MPEVSVKSLDVLLGVTSGSMLGVATFAVGSMLIAYSSASNTATPRSFPLVIADDISQNTLSSFIGAFIFSIVAIVALENGYYGPQGVSYSLSSLSFFCCHYIEFHPIAGSHCSFRKAWQYHRQSRSGDKRIFNLAQTAPHNGGNESK
ncbi:MAG: DUF2254 family protein [Brevefilum sp.]|nr:DUF2254 domain-containing protein [Brevefilum sp.]MDT8381739.1 DUF2254 family protein [Brevefilum sp.]MDW7754056.1 DUF2254 family protein [Brevefilum sp.]